MHNNTDMFTATKQTGYDRRYYEPDARVTGVPCQNCNLRNWTARTNALPG